MFSSRSAKPAPAIAVATVLGALLTPSGAEAVDPFEIQVYDGEVAAPGEVGVELHVNSVLSGHRQAVSPELPTHHQSHFTLEPAIGITDWWEAGIYLQTALLADGSFHYAGSKLRTKFVIPGRPDSAFRWGVNLEVSRLPSEYDRNRWGAEIRPIATWTPPAASIYVSVNPIVDLTLAGPDRGEAPVFAPAATACYIIAGLGSLGLEYYADFGPVGGWHPASAQEHYLYEVANVLRWKHLNLNIGIGEGLTDGSNRFVAKMILGLEI